MAGGLKYIQITLHEKSGLIYLEVKEIEIVEEAYACYIQHEFSCAAKICAFIKNESTHCDVHVCAGLQVWSLYWSYGILTLHKEICGLIHGDLDHL